MTLGWPRAKLGRDPPLGAPFNAKVPLAHDLGLRLPDFCLWSLSLLLVLVQGKWVLQLPSCPTAWAGMRSQGGVLSKMLAWLE